MPELRRVATAQSTMMLAHELARFGAEAGDGVVAEIQSGARGTRGRSWSSGQGGIWLSVILRPPPGANVELLPLRIGLAVAQALEARCGSLPPLGLKWPNDLMLQQRKIGGVLCEAHWRGNNCRWVVVGVGVNVFNTLPAELGGIATRIADHQAALPPLEELQAAVWQGIRAHSGWDEQLSRDELAMWQQRDVLSGKRITSPLPGIASGVAATGALLVTGDDGVCHEVKVGVARNDE